MVNLSGKQKKLFAAGSIAAVLVLGIAVFTLGGGSNDETPPAASQSNPPEVTVSDIPQPEVSVPVVETPQTATPSADPVLNVEDETHVEVNLSDFEKPESTPEPPKIQDESALTNPDKPPVYDEGQKVVEPSSTAPQNGEKQSGSIYIEGFGWIKDEGGGTVEIPVGGAGDELTGNQVGQMD